MALAYTPTPPLSGRGLGTVRRGTTASLRRPLARTPRTRAPGRAAAAVAAPSMDDSIEDANDRKEVLRMKMDQLEYYTLKNMEENFVLLNERTQKVLQQVSEEDMDARVRALKNEIKNKSPADAVPNTRLASPPPFLDLSASSLLWFQPNIANLVGVQHLEHPVKPHLRLKMMTKLKAKLKEQANAVDTLREIRNFRDLASASPGLLRPYSVFRCANPLQCSEENATLMQQNLGVRLVLDLRAPDELEEADLAGPLLGEGASLTFRRKLSRRGQKEWATNVRKAVETAVVAGAESARAGTTRCNVSILNQKPFYERLKRKMPPKWQFEQALAAWFFPKAGTKMFMEALNKGGLWLLNEVILDTAGPEIAASMIVIKEAVKMDVPIVIFCRAGKDRTGLLSALTLYCCGIPKEQIMKDYTLSGRRKSELEGSALPSGLKEDAFTGAPAEVMEKTFKYLEDTWGSPEEYLSAHGFDKSMQEELKLNLVIRSVMYYDVDNM